MKIRELGRTVLGSTKVVLMEPLYNKSKGVYHVCKYAEVWRGVFSHIDTSYNSRDILALYASNDYLCIEMGDSDEPKF